MTWMHWQLAATLSSGRATHKPAGPTALPPLLFLTDDERTPDPVAAIAQLPRQCGVIFRHYKSANRSVLAERCREAAGYHGHRFLIAGDYALARDLGADGLHLPEHMAHQAQRVRQRQPRWHITLAVHSTLALHRAQDLAVNALLASPVFATQSHPGRPSLGPFRLAAMSRAGALPIYGLGGINNRNSLRLKDAGLSGIAAIGALLSPSKEKGRPQRRRPFINPSNMT